jgi:hypothetical protein
MVLFMLSHELDPLLETVNTNLEKARAARAAEILAENAKAVKALPK